MPSASSRSCQSPLSAAKLGDLQTFADALQTWRPVRARTLAAIKSLLAFSQRTGFGR